MSGRSTKRWAARDMKWASSEKVKAEAEQTVASYLPLPIRR
jgi:hypothetical protein